MTEELEETLDPEELAEAEALAYALERGGGSEELPEDALEAAALLRYSVDGGELPRDREDAILGEVLEVAQKAAARAPEPKRRPWWAWLFGFAGAAGVAALLLFFVLVQQQPAPDLPTPSDALPTPSASLLQLSMGRVAAPEDDAAFDAAMREYRGNVYDALAERYRGR